MNIQLLNKIAAVGLAELGEGYNVGEDIANHLGREVTLKDVNHSALQIRP